MDDLELQTVGIVEECRVVPGPVRVLLGLALDFDVLGPHPGGPVVDLRDGTERAKVDARSLFQKLVETRLATGEPYIIFIDQVNRSMPKHHRDLGLKVTTSNLCSEITLPTGKDHLGADRTAVCCLSSLALETWDEWNGDKRFIEDVMRFLDNVLADYIARAPDEMARAKYSAERERSVGLGVMGFHSFLQARGLPFEGAMAKSWNLKIFKHIRAQVDQASMMLAQERGPCPDAADMGVMERFSCKMAIAPTASISKPRPRITGSSPSSSSLPPATGRRAASTFLCGTARESRRWPPSLSPPPHLTAARRCGVTPTMPGCCRSAASG